VVEKVVVGVLVRAELRLRDRSIGSLPVTPEYDGQGHYIAPQAMLTMPRQWELTLLIRTSDVGQAVLKIPMEAR
jgi:copper transport protein